MIKAKKSLGQNFLKDNNILKKIVNTTEIENKTVIEIGPGTGNLTSFILNKKPKKLIVIEKDGNLVKFLKQSFKDQITIIHDDILNINENTFSNEKVTVFGNLPYNISTEILSNWIINFKDDLWFDCLVLMFQKEVADRIIADYNTSNYGRLSIISNWRLNIKKICDINRNSFYPKPKIESSLLFFYPKKKYTKIKNPRNLQKLTRIFFNQRRKMLKKPFKQLFNENLEVSDKLKINLNLRPQNLTCDTYYKIVCEYEDLRS